MNIIAHMGVGPLNVVRTETLEIDDAELDGLSEIQLRHKIEDAVHAWALEYLEYWWDESP